MEGIFLGGERILGCFISRLNNFVKNKLSKIKINSIKNISGYKIIIGFCVKDGMVVESQQSQIYTIQVSSVSPVAAVLVVDVIVETLVLISCGIYAYAIIIIF